MINGNITTSLTVSKFYSPTCWLKVRSLNSFRVISVFILKLTYDYFLAMYLFLPTAQMNFITYSLIMFK